MPLIVATRLGNLDVMRLLLRHAAAVDAIGKDGKSSIFFAIHRGDRRVLQLLLDHGAGVSSIAAFDFTLAIWSTCGTSDEVLALLHPLKLAIRFAERLLLDVYNISSSGGIEPLHEFFVRDGHTDENNLCYYFLEGVEAAGFHGPHLILDL